MDHDPAQIFLITALAAIGLVIVVPLIIYLGHKLFFFDWPPLYEWQQARRQLRPIDRWHVIWATRRNHPAIQAALAGAQLTYARYLQARAERALDRRRRQRGLRVSLAVCLGVVAAGDAVIAATQRQLRIIDSVAAASFTMLAFSTLVADPWLLRRQIERMARLQAEIERAPEMPPDGRQQPTITTESNHRTRRSHGH